MSLSTAYWNKMGSDWDLVGPPLRPCSEDKFFMEHLVDRWAHTSGRAAPQEVIRDAIGYPMNISFIYQDSIRIVAGKHEEFRSEI